MNIRQSKLEKQWRKDKVEELASDGLSNREISTKLKIPHATVDRIVLALKEESRAKIGKYIDEQVPYEYHKTLIGLNGIIKYMASIIEDESNETKERMQAASIKLQAYNIKMEMVSGATLIKKGIDLVNRYRGYTTQKDKVLTDGIKQSA